MTAPRAREQADPPSPPDRRPPRRGTGSSPSIYAASAAGRRVPPVARRGLVRCARALAAAALLALTGALFLPPTAEAQTGTTLVSNVGQSTYTTGSRRQVSQPFDTGSNEDGYTLTGVDVASASSTGFTAQVCGVDSTNRPTSACWDLMPPGTFAVGTMSFTAPTNTVLGKSTTYTVVVKARTTNTQPSGETWEGVHANAYAQGWGFQTSSGANDEDAGSAAGWSIGDTGHYVSAENTLNNNTWITNSRDLRIAIKGSAAGGGTPTNNPPVFTSSASLSVEENTYSATVVAVDNDTDDDITDYAITGGTDEGFFEDVTSAGVLTFEETPNFEDPEDSGTDNTYVVTVEATSGTGTREMTATQTITVTVTDADEKSAKPDKPTLAAVTGSSTTLTATWAEPDLDGGPAIAGYAVQYKVNTATTWEDFAHSGTAVTTTVTGLTADTSYQVQVRAKNGETDSDWSDASDAVKTNAEMSTPTCTLNTGDLWCGVVTVGLYSLNGVELGDGFVDAATDTGALSDKTFSVGTNNYTIDLVFIGRGTNAGVLFLSLTSALTAADRAKLVLHVDGSSGTFAVSDATAPSASFTYEWTGTGLDWSSETSVTLRLRANTAPVFADDLVAITLPENSAVGTSVGAVVTATDADDDTLTYSLEGTDAASFDIDSGTGQIKTKSGVTYDFEATQNTYEMTVKADDGNGGTDTIEVNIALLDADEKSAKPDKPTLAAVTGSTTTLTATWAEPDLNGGPDITGYKLEYKLSTETSWTEFAHTGTAVTATVTGLTADTAYQARVLAENGETDSDWSDPSDAVKTNAAGAACTDNDIDLVRGMDNTEGSVQICHSNEWRSVCDDSFDQDTDAEVANGWAFAGVVCRQRGHATGAATESSHFGQVFPVSYWLDEVVCTGSEANLGACTHADWGVSDCRFPERAGVRCTVAATGLMATGGDREVALAWDAPGADPGITRHEYRYKTTGGTYPAAWTPVPDSAADETNEASHTVTGLAAGTGYDFELRIVGGANASGADAATARTTGVAAPTNFMAMAGDAQVMLSWDAPATGSGVTKHQYRQKTTGSYAGWTDIPNSAEDGANEASHTVTGLTNDRAYTFELRAVKDGTNSDPAEAGPVTPTAMTTPTCTPNPGDLWCGVVTVGLHTVGGFQVGYGYADASVSTNTSDTGVLSDRTFSVGTNNYTIDQVVVGSGANAGAFLLRLNSALTAADLAALVLHVDGGSASFAFSDAIGPILNPTYQWNGTGLDWSSATYVTLRLRAATETDASLSALTVTRSGGVTVPLRPAFAPGTVEYRASVANPVDEVTVAAEANVAEATLEYLDGDGAAIADADTNTPGREVALEVGEETVVEVKVTAEDGTTTKTYTVTVTRRAPDAPGREGEFRLAPETEDDYVDEDNDRHGGTAGRVEVYHAGAWGTVCSDGIRYSSFSTFDHDPATGALIMDPDGNPAETEYDNEAAALICKAMDYDDGEYAPGFGQSGVENPPYAYYPVGSSYPADGPKPIWLDDLTCVAGSGFVPSADPLPGVMSHCSYAGWGLHNCTHKEDAGVRCWNNDAAGPGLKSLKGRFVSPPERHDGTNRVKVRVAFSEPVEESPENVGAHGVEVEGGEVTSVSPVGGDARDGAGTRSAGGRNAGGEDREVVWEFEIEPDSDGDLTVTLEAGRPCGEPGAICTADGRALSEGISTTVEGPEAPPPLTASFGNMPEAHDGTGAFRFRVAFSENIGISYRSLREDAFAVSGGRVTRGRRVDDRRDLFEMTVEPDGDGEVTVTLPAGRECSVSGAICTKGENRRQLTNAPTATVAGPAVETGPAGLTARFVDMPSEHDGETAFKFRIAFSEEIRMSGRRLRSDVVAVSGGRATKAGRVNRPKDLWKLKVRPDSLADVTVTLSSGAACDTPGAVCTADGRALSNTISATVEGPVAVSVADARVREAAGATLDFAVSLSRAAAGPVSVTWATADGSATAGSDYRAGQGKLRFAPGETEKTIPVPVLDDAHDEGEETMQLRLTASSGAAIADGVATGTIENTDHMPAAWLARFGRTVTDQVLGAVEARLSAPRAPGARATLAGQALPSWDAANDDATAAADPGTGSGAGVSERGLAARDRDAMTAIRDWMARAGTDGSGAGANGSGADAWRGEGRDDRTRSRALTGRDFLTGTSFALTGGSAEAGGYAALWGRGAISRFDGREGDLTLDGEVTTGLMGADWASAPGSGSRRWTAGLAFGHARGTGGYREGGGCEGESCAGEVEATLTGVWPYAGLTLTDRLSAWAAAGYGAGELKLTPGGETDGPFKADLTMAMGAAGLRGEVLTPPPDGGLALALKGDARFTRTASEATKDAKGGNLAAATADVWLLRTGIEGSRRFAPGGDASGMVLTPSFEIGARLDGGDAETGLGVDLGGGLAFAAPKQGVALDLKARGLIAHQASGFREWGASASLTWDPRPTTDRGFALTLRQGWGGSPTGGMDALLRRETLAGLAANDNGDTTSAGRLEAELGYGIALFGGGFTGTPHLGFGLSDTARDYRVGWRLTSARRGDPGFQVDLDATRREAADADAEHGIVLRCTMRW